jgi:TetR/AcrR family tetracycline transcriptional repressor
MQAMADDTFNADEVIRAALALLDDVGLRRFTMRALADRLGTYPATIYWHVGGRTDVLSAVAGLVLTEMVAETPDPVSMPWDEWLTASARAYRRVMKLHPDLAAWAVTHLEASVPVPEFLERIVSALSRAGFRDAHLAAAYNTFVGSLCGWVGMEMIRDDSDLGSSPERMQASLRELTADDYPTIVANLEHLADRAFTFRWRSGILNPLDDAFEFAVATWVEGLRSMLSAP